MLEVGLHSVKEAVVTEELTAAAMGSGGLRVYATPAMIALAEEAAWKGVEGALAEDETTVGTYIDIAHTSASPVGMKVTAIADLVKVEGRKLTFDIKVYDAHGIIGKGTHGRVIIKTERFMQKVEGKL